ncbi:MAG: SHD1 domain-containing protein [Pirellulaceae bacterium]
MFSRIVFLTFLVLASNPSLQARVWTDVSGNYTLEADMIGFDATAVILQRDDGELGAFPIDKLSEQDKAYLKSKEAKDLHASTIDQTQVWHLTNGLKVTGRIVDFAQRDVTVQARRGKTYVNNIVFENLPQIYQFMLPLIVEHLEPTGDIDKKGFKDWVRSLKGKPKTFQLSGVLFELENGDEYGVPFFLFTSEEQKLLKPGWDRWLTTQADAAKAEQESFMLQSAAAAYKNQQERYAQEEEQRRRNEAFHRQIAVMNLQFQAIQSGITSAWEITLYPLPGTYARPRWVVAYGRNSLEATQNALRANPGFRDGAVRKLSR